MEYVTLAKVVSTHGIKGDLKLFPLTDFAKIRFKKGKTFCQCQCYDVFYRYCSADFRFAGALS